MPEYLYYKKASFSFSFKSGPGRPHLRMYQQIDWSGRNFLWFECCWQNKM